MPKRRRMNRASTLGLAGLAVVTLAAVGFVLTENRGAPADATSPQVQQYYNEHVANAPQPTIKSREQPKVAFLGDSYTAAAEHGGGYIPTLATVMHWTPVLFGQGGTGYVNPGQAAEKESAFPERVADVVKSGASIVIVQGGINDNSTGPVRDAAADVFQELKVGLPAAKIVAVGPVGAPGMSRASITAARDGIKAAADAAGVTFIDPLAEDWLADATFDTAGVHPNDAGYQQLAQKLVSALAAKGIQPA